MALEFAAGWDAPLKSLRQQEPIVAKLTEPILEQTLREAKSRITGNGRSKEVLNYMERDFGPMVQVTSVESPGWIPNGGSGCALAHLEYRGLGYHLVLRLTGGNLEAADISN